MTVGDIALNPEMSGDPSTIVVDAEVVTLDPNGSAIHAPFVGLRVQMTGVEHCAPPRLATVEVMREEFRWRLSDELREWHAVLSRIGFVCDRHALMLKDVLEHHVLVSGVLPLDRLIEH